MEGHKHHGHENDQSEIHSAESKAAGNNGCSVYRQTSSRWSPTSEQIQILKDLFYNAGIRSPTSEQIQSITARLRQYGKIEPKNVFYWFQNHKTRERQKRRFHTTANSKNTSGGSISDLDRTYYMCPNGSTDQDGVRNGGHMDSYGRGSVKMEKHFKGRSMSPTGSSNPTSLNGVSMEQGSPNWVSMDQQYTHYSLLNKPRPLLHPEVPQEVEEEDHKPHCQTRKTLPLFPMHGEDRINGGGGNAMIHGCSGLSQPSHYHPPEWHPSSGTGACASLELGLNLYMAEAPDH